MKQAFLCCHFLLLFVSVFKNLFIYFTFSEEKKSRRYWGLTTGVKKGKKDQIIETYQISPNVEITQAHWRNWFPADHEQGKGSGKQTLFLSHILSILSSRFHMKLWVLAITWSCIWLFRQSCGTWVHIFWIRRIDSEGPSTDSQFP